MKKFMFTFGLSCLLISFALAHSNITASNPKDHARIAVMPKIVSLDFDEAIETKLSVFKIYYLPENMMMKNGKMISGSQMDDVAEAFSKKMLNAKDTTDRVDAGLSANTAKQSMRVELMFKANTKRSGVYVVMWRSTSVDTHVETGFIHFHFRAKP